MPEYIDREKAVDALLTEMCMTGYQSRAINVIRMIEKEDVVPVVRCRECRHYKESRTKKYGNPICRCTRMGKYDMDYPVRPYDFCSYGEKTDNSTEN